MEMPETIRVRISSEAAQFIALTPVVMRQMPVGELVGLILEITAKDPARIREILLRGSFVSGGSRLRWQGWEAEPRSLEALLSTFPDPDPGRPFARERCLAAVLKQRQRPVEISRALAERRGILRRQSPWDALMELAGAGAPRYLGYSYSRKADGYAVELTEEGARRLRASAGAARDTGLRSALRETMPGVLELWVARE